jgi:hypothetical protein
MKVTWLFPLFLLLAPNANAQPSGIIFNGPSTMESGGEYVLTAVGENNSNYIVSINVDPISLPVGINVRMLQIVQSYDIVSRQPTKIKIWVENRINQPVSFSLKFDAIISHFSTGAPNTQEKLSFNARVNPVPIPPRPPLGSPCKILLCL